jgi:hypothetical protein
MIILFSPVLSSEVDSGLSAVELNTRGYELYEQKKYAEALDYFHASFEKDQNYVYPHYNFACVLSLLCGQDEEKWGDYEYEITLHLLISMRLSKKYQAKYFNDSDLQWYRGKMNIYHSERDYSRTTLNEFTPSADPAAIKNALLGEGYWQTGNTAGLYWSIASVSFYENGGAEIKWENGSEPGTYQIFGNMVYVVFNQTVEYFHFQIKDFYLIYLNGHFEMFYCDGGLNQFDPGSAQVDYGA